MVFKADKTSQLTSDSIFIQNFWITDNNHTSICNSANDENRKMCPVLYILGQKNARVKTGTILLEMGCTLTMM